MLQTSKTLTLLFTALLTLSTAAITKSTFTVKPFQGLDIDSAKLNEIIFTNSQELASHKPNEFVFSVSDELSETEYIVLLSQETFLVKKPTDEINDTLTTLDTSLVAKIEYPFFQGNLLPEREPVLFKNDSGNYCLLQVNRYYWRDFWDIDSITVTVWEQNDKSSWFEGLSLSNEIPVPAHFSARSITEHSDSDFEFTWSYTPSDSLKGFRITADSIATFDVGITDTVNLIQGEIISRLKSNGWEYRNPAVYYVQAIYEVDGNTIFSSPSNTSSAIFIEEVGTATAAKKMKFTVINNSKELIVVGQTGIKSLQLISANGTVLLSRKETDINSINIENITPGIYFLNIITAAGNISHKVVIQ